MKLLYPMAIFVLLSNILVAQPFDVEAQKALSESLEAMDSQDETLKIEALQELRRSLKLLRRGQVSLAEDMERELQDDLEAALSQRQILILRHVMPIMHSLAQQNRLTGPLPEIKAIATEVASSRTPQQWSIPDDCNDCEWVIAGLGHSAVQTLLLVEGLTEENMHFLDNLPNINDKFAIEAVAMYLYDLNSIIARKSTDSAASSVQEVLRGIQYLERKWSGIENDAMRLDLIKLLVGMATFQDGAIKSSATEFLNKLSMEPELKATIDYLMEKNESFLGVD